MYVFTQFLCVTQVNITTEKKEYLCAFFRKYCWNTSSWGKDPPGIFIFSIFFGDSNYIVLQKEKVCSCSFLFRPFRFIVVCFVLKISSNFKLHLFSATPQYTQIFTSNSLHNIHYSLLLHVSATGYGHLKGTSNFIDLYSTHCKTCSLCFDSPSGSSLPHRWGFDIALRHTTLGTTPLDEWLVRCRDLSWQHTTFKTDVHSCPRWDWNSKLRRRAIAVSRFIWRGHRNWPYIAVSHMQVVKMYMMVSVFIQC